MALLTLFSFIIETTHIQCFGGCSIEYHININYVYMIKLLYFYIIYIININYFISTLFVFFISLYLKIWDHNWLSLKLNFWFCSPVTTGSAWGTHMVMLLGIKPKSATLRPYPMCKAIQVFLNLFPTMITF